jgi:hypothetical protein
MDGDAPSQEEQVTLLTLLSPLTLLTRLTLLNLLTLLTRLTLLTLLTRLTLLTLLNLMNLPTLDGGDGADRGEECGVTGGRAAIRGTTVHGEELNPKVCVRQGIHHNHRHSLLVLARSAYPAYFCIHCHPCSPCLLNKRHANTGVASTSSALHTFPLLTFLCLRSPHRGHIYLPYLFDNYHANAGVTSTVWSRPRCSGPANP